tara:strand:- start:567 stop:1541 length:975 start_codon:yes stop_codon:yes gene_type:complete
VNTQHDSYRSLANTTALRVFVNSLARRSGNVAARELEQQIQNNFRRFIMEVPDGSDVGNWARIGITKEQAKRINSLYDDLPYMNKVHKWIMENVTVLARGIKPSIARTVYNEISGGRHVLVNPYAGMTDDAAQSVLNRRNQNRPGSVRNNNAAKMDPPTIYDDILGRNRRIASATESLQLNKLDSNAKKYILDNISVSDDFVKNNPLLASNMNHSAESALMIVKKTGRRSVGPGCKQFNEKASAEILELKARVDMRRAQIIEQKAYAKAGDTFNSVDDIDDALRLSQKEIDDATEEAFEEVLGYTKVEARAAIKRLKAKPCKVY